MTSHWRHRNKTHSELNSLQNVYFGFFIFWILTEWRCFVTYWSDNPHTNCIMWIMLTTDIQMQAATFFPQPLTPSCSLKANILYSSTPYWFCHLLPVGVSDSVITVNTVCHINTYQMHMLRVAISYFQT